MSSFMSSAINVLTYIQASPSSGINIATSNGFGYIALAFGVLLSTGAIAWFLRSGTSLALARDTAEKSYVISTDNVSRIVALETQQKNTEGDVSSIAAQMAVLAARMENIVAANNLELSKVQLQCSKMETVLNEVRSRMSPLDHIGEWVEFTKNIKDQLKSLQEMLQHNYVPREEIKARFNLMEQRVDSIDSRK